MTDLGRAAWPDVESRAAKGLVVLVPLGATEQHGPHLPVTTDTDVAAAVAERAATLVPVVVAPPLAYGASGEHEDFAGTLSMGTAATERAIVELGRSASRHFEGIVFVSTHGGNRDAVEGATHVLRSERRSVVAWSPRWPGDLHAGRTETSLMLAIAPDRVDLTAAAAGDLRSPAALLPVLRQQGVRAVSPNGVLGDPSGATAEEGRRLLAAAARELAELATRLARGPTVAAMSKGVR